jgi:AcrR family transcriptional regulator
MGAARFTNADFVAAARAQAHDNGPATVTVDSVIQRLRAPRGSFYHRYPSRDVLLGELWLSTIVSFQEGFVAAIEADDGLAAALHTARWARKHLEDARLLLVYSRHDFVEGEWPAALKEGVRAQAQRIHECVNQFAQRTFGSGGQTQRRRSLFVLCELPLAAVKGYLERRERPPALVDELITLSYRAIVEHGKQLNQSESMQHLSSSA